MKSISFAGLVGLACLGAQAQSPTLAPAQPLGPVLVTATRGIEAAPTLREATVITREDLDRSGSLSLAEVLFRRAGVEFRATGGAGQPAGLFMRGGGSAQSLVLVDGLRVGSATVGTTSIENIPLELIERIEVVKGPLSSLYGTEAMGGVIQIFTRGKKVPHLHATVGYGTDTDQRAAGGLTGADADTSFSLAAGYRKVQARSATNARGFCHDPDRDPHENAFFDAKVAHRMWQGETVALNAFHMQGRTHFDGCADDFVTPRDGMNDQKISGAGVSSSSQFLPWWAGKLSLGHGRDEIATTGAFPSRFETRQDQAAWVNEFATGQGIVRAGLEWLRQRVLPERRYDETSGQEVALFTRNRREIRSTFLGLAETWRAQRLEASARRDDDDQFGKRSTGSVSYGFAWPSVGTLSGTYGQGFRAPTFYDLYGPSDSFYQPNPNLKPERSKSSEWALAGEPIIGIRWRLTAFDNRIEDLIAYRFPSVENVARARIKGVEASAQAAWLGLAWHANLTVQRPRDEDTGKRLQGRSERFGTLEGRWSSGAWSAGFTVLASGERFDSTDESPASRLPSYAVLDARLRYALADRWFAELSATNLLDRKYETAVGYDAPRRAVFLNLRFEAF